MTYNEICDQALARCAEFGVSFPEQRSVSLRRVGVRQQQLFSRANRLDPDYFGVCATGAPVGGALDLRDLVEPVARLDRVTYVEIATPGTSSYAAGDVVHVVPPSDKDQFYAPRVTLRDWVLLQVGTDLANVGTLKVGYSKLSLAVKATDGAVESELPVQFQDLLVVDQAMQMIRKVLDLGAADKEKALTLLAAEEEVLLTEFDAHVLGFAAAREARFGNHGGYR